MIMGLELLKKSWENLDRKIQNVATFNEKLIESIVASKVITTVDKIKRLYTSFFIVLSVEIIFLVAIFFGNPFDFKYNIQYAPYALLIVGVIIAFVNLAQITLAIRKLSPASRIDLYIKDIISIYDRNKRFEGWFGAIFLSVGLLVPLSFLPNKIERYGMAGAWMDMAIMTSITLALYLIAFKLGAFKNPYKEKLIKELVEWKDLRGLAEDMKG